MPSETEIRDHRQRAILELLEAEPVASQVELAERLSERGFAVTQSSISRDFRDLGVIKVHGRYVAPRASGPRIERLRELAPFLRGQRPAGPHLLVLQTLVGAAQTVAVALDGAEWPEVVGTVAGDDTVFIACAHARDQQRLMARLGAIFEANGEQPERQGQR
ncbi:MAG TPA: arginine repressor [Thermoanaerobaculia bacterium]|nr:arginine repressor [Thermoanaerobaculia bacterium]